MNADEQCASAASDRHGQQGLLPVIPHLEAKLKALPAETVESDGISDVSFTALLSAQIAEW